MGRSFNVLISSVGRRVELVDNFRDALKSLNLEGRVDAIDLSRTAPAFHLADRAFQVPRCTNFEFIPRVLEICKENEIDLVIPTIDTELAMYADSRDEFRAIGTRIAVSSPEVIAICNDKISTHRWLKQEGLPTVEQGNVEEVIEGIASGSWEFPLLVKPVNGSMSRGVAIVNDLDELRAATADEEFIVQTIAPGDEYTVSFYADSHGQCRCAIPRRRLEVRAGEVSKGLTIRNERIEEIAFEVCNRLPGAYGALNVQVFFNPDTEELNIIEINPRFGGGFPLACRAGGDYPKWMIEEILGKPTTASNDLWKDRLMMLRYDRAVYVSEEPPTRKDDA